MCCVYLVESCLFWVTLGIKEVTGKCCLKVMDFRLTFETFTISSDKASSVQNTKKITDTGDNDSLDVCR